MVKGHDGLDGAEQRNRIGCENFIKGLRADIKETVWEKCPASFQEAIQAAERREVFLSSLCRRSRINEVSDDLVGLVQKFNDERVRSNDEIWKAIQDLTKVVQGIAAQQAQPIHALPVPAVRASLETGKPSPYMFYCCQPGHLKRNCPKKPQNATVSRSNQATSTPSS